MDTRTYRQKEGLSQSELAARLGVKAKSYMSRLETGQQRWPAKLALRMQRVSGGKVTAASLCPDLADAFEMADAPPGQT